MDRPEQEKPRLSRSLEGSLVRAISIASERRREFATVEHLLLALTKDRHADALLVTCGINLDGLRKEVLRYIANKPRNSVSGYQGQAKPAADFGAALERAIRQVTSSGRDEINGDDVLIAILAEHYALPQTRFRRW